MLIGAVYPQIELGGDPHCLRRFAQEVEGLGLDHLVLYDHVLGAVRTDREPPLLGGPYTERDPFHDPLVAFAHLAALTTRIDFLSGVMVLPQRQTALVARQAADVQLLSGGRLHLGVGTGWNHIEYESLGADFATRGARLSEQMRVLRELWSGAPVDFAGDFHRIDRAALVPPPTAPVPLYCGGASEPAFRRAAELADGFLFAGPLAELASPAWTRVQQLLRERGRPLERFRAQYHVMGADIGGLPLPDVVRALESWREAGGTHASIVTMGRGYRTVEEHLEHVAEVAEAFARG